VNEEIMAFLEFIADDKNWQSPSKGFALQYDPEPSPIEKDARRRARKLLKKMREA